MPRRFRDPFEAPPPRPDRDEERSKPSWSEIDARRNRSAHVAQDKPTFREPPQLKRDEALAKKALNEFFSGKKSKEQESAWKKVCEVTGSLFSRRASAYVEKNGMPRAWDDLLRLLDHNDSAFATTVLEKMMEMAPNETPARRDLLIGKLRVTRMTAEEPELISKFDRSLQTLAALNA